MHWGLLAAWRYLKDGPNPGPRFDIERLTRLMGESIVGSVTRKLERSGSRGSFAQESEQLFCAVLSLFGLDWKR